jgi:formylglycine-generating enzyme required for sulfatase activity
MAAASAAVACDAAPRGEALIVVDTDMPVPKIVDHLRVDIYSADGARWWASRDIYLPDPALWPASFSVYTNDTSAGASALVRLRGYRSGYLQDYLGEGPIPLPPLGTQWSAAQASKCCSRDCISLCPAYWLPTDDCSANCPRLLDSTQSPVRDVTPATEPQPLVTIDRLIHVDLVPGNRGKVVVTLAGACAGSQAVLPDPSRDSPSLDDIQTCVDTERTLIPVTASTLDPDMSLPPVGSSAQGQFEAPYDIDCATTPRKPTSGRFDDEICVRGGVMILGDKTGFSPTYAPSIPRIAAIPSFLIDKYEYSVARLQSAIAAGVGGVNTTSVTFNNGPSNDSTLPISSPANCTAYSVSGSWATADRNATAVNCITWDAARSLCKHDGGDLPLEAQWEYAASAAGRPVKSFDTQTPSGDFPTCADVAFGRSTYLGSDDCYMTSPAYFGVARVDYGNDIVDRDGGGVFGMTGNLAEMALDANVSMAANCWLSAPISSPSCIQPVGTPTIMRGANWEDLRAGVTTRWRERIVKGLPAGFRCVR